MKLKRRLSLLAAVFMGTAALAGCGGQGDPPVTEENNYRPVEEALTDTVTPLQGGGVAFAAGDRRFELYAAGEGYSLRSVNGEGGSAFFSESPVFVAVKKSGEAEETEYESKYGELRSRNGHVVALGEIETENGSLIRVEDEFVPLGGLVNLTRTVSVTKSAAGDEGYSTRLSLRVASNAAADATGDFADIDWFIPSIWYKDGALNPPSAIAASYRNKQILVKETRTGLPLVMGRDRATGETLSLCHFDPQISSDVSDLSAANFLTDENYRCGSLGAVRDPSPAVTFCYPTAELPIAYASSYSVVKRYHPIREGFSSSFTLSMRASHTDDYLQAETETYRIHSSLQEKEIYDVDLEKAYTATMSLVNDYCYEANDVFGIPYGAFVTDGHVESGLTMEMGFVGMELSIAAEMMRYGEKYGDEKSLSNGERIADLWAETAHTDSGVVKAYMLPNGSFYPMPCYLRRMTDGMEGMLSCLTFMADRGTEKPAWEQMVMEYAQFLLGAQNEDGSWYRAFDYAGQLFTPDNSFGQHCENNYNNGTADASSKNSTPIPIRFLVELYKFTGEEKYLDSAKRAAEFVIEELFPAGKFGGATCDGRDRTDRETGVYVLYGMNALYEVTGEKRYLGYAETAAVYTCSWAFLYPYKVADPTTALIGGPFAAQPLNDGMSVICSGSSGSDNFLSYIYYDLFRLYAWTEDEYWYDMALFFQNNTKKILNWDGHMNYAHEGFVQEATGLSDFCVRTAGEDRGVWLPWSSNAILEPMAKMRETFGTFDVRDLKSRSFEELRGLLSQKQ